MQPRRQRYRGGSPRSRYRSPGPRRSQRRRHRRRRTERSQGPSRRPLRPRPCAPRLRPNNAPAFGAKAGALPRAGNELSNRVCSAGKALGVTGSEGGAAAAAGGDQAGLRHVGTDSAGGHEPPAERVSDVGGGGEAHLDVHGRAELHPCAHRGARRLGQLCGQQKPPLKSGSSRAMRSIQAASNNKPTREFTRVGQQSIRARKSPQETIVLLTTVEHRRRRGRECRLRLESRGDAVEDSGDADRLGFGVLGALEQAGGEATVDGLGLVGEARAVCGAATSDGQPAVSSGRIGEGQSRQMPLCHGHEDGPLSGFSAVAVMIDHDSSVAVDAA